jgi:hypothetical protein
VRGQHERHVAQHRRQAVVALAEVVELADQVEEPKSASSASQHERARGEDLARDVAEQHQRSIPPGARRARRPAPRPRPWRSPRGRLAQLAQVGARAGALELEREEERLDAERVDDGHVHEVLGGRKRANSSPGAAARRAGGVRAAAAAARAPAPGLLDQPSLQQLVEEVRRRADLRRLLAQDELGLRPSIRISIVRTAGSA